MPPRKKAAGKAKAAGKSAPKKAAGNAKKAPENKTSAGKRPRSPDSSSGSESGDSVVTSPRTKPAQKRAKKGIQDLAPEPEPEPEVDERSPCLDLLLTYSQAPADRGPHGKFDLYAMELPFLADVYLPPGQSASEPQFSALYDKILEYQAKPDSTAQCVIPGAPVHSSKTKNKADAKDTAEEQKSGRLESAIFEDPMEGAPWEIALVDLKVCDPIVFPPKERKQFATAPQVNCGRGIEGRTELAMSHCGVQSAGGVFRMQRAWTGKRGGDTVEVWEGYLSFNVVHSGLYKRKRHGGGQAIGFPFWGVRARKDEAGKEIGLSQ
ncbi:hypothetical protein C8R47DRAFT_1082776 [Mycena vitilis]|nr:hypothetical protein C8R47DRAFT_1082776 [Mycena vitilis]